MPGMNQEDSPTLSLDDATGSPSHKTPNTDDEAQPLPEVNTSTESNAAETTREENSSSMQVEDVGSGSSGQGSADFFPSIPLSLTNGNTLDHSTTHDQLEADITASSEKHVEPTTEDSGESPSTPVNTRPKRAAATAANERMARRSTKIPSSADNTTNDGSTTVESEANGSGGFKSPPRKRRARNGTSSELPSPRTPIVVASAEITMPRRKAKRTPQIVVASADVTPARKSPKRPAETVVVSAEVTPGSGPRRSNRKLPAAPPAAVIDVSPPRMRRQRKNDSESRSVQADADSDAVITTLKASKGKNVGVAEKKSAPRKKRVVDGKVTTVADDVYIRSLCGMLRVASEEKDKIGKLVDSWVEVYKADHLMGYLEIANFFIHSAGCKGRITYPMASMNHGDVIQQLTVKFNEESNEYPLAKNDKEFRKFKLDFCKFLQTMITTIKDTILYDGYFIDTLFSFLSELCDSQVRAFRHTGALGLMKMLTSLVQISVDLKNTLDTDEQQLNKDKSGNKRANPARAGLLQKTFDEHRRQADAIRTHFDKACKSVFYQRYRDGHPVVRELCIEELGAWMMIFPERYVDDSYLKYLGWSLNDKEPIVRRRCLAVSLPLFEDEEMIPRLQLFSNKFKDRFIQMTSDVDAECCIKAGKVVQAMNRTQPELFDGKDQDRIFELIYAADRSLAVIAGEIVLSRMRSLAETDRKHGRRFKSGNEWTDDVWDVYEIVRFYVESPAVHSHCAYLVDSLIDICPTIRSWKAFTDLLMEEPDNADANQAALSDAEEKALIEVMSWSIKHSVLGEIPPGRTHAGKKGKIKDGKQLHDIQMKMTAHFIDVLPRLIAKFKQDPYKLIYLISIPQYFDVDLYTTNHKEPEVDLLLSSIVESFEKSDDPSFLKHSTKSLLHLEQQGTGIVNQVAIHRTTLFDSVLSKFSGAVQHWLAGEDETQLQYDMETAIRRLHALLMIMAPPTNTFADMWNSLMEILDKSVALKGNKVIRAVITCCMSCVMWEYKGLKERSDGTEPSEEEVEQHKKRLDAFVDLLLPMLEDQEFPIDSAGTAFTTLMDLLVLHHKHAADVPAWQSNLVFQLPDDEQSIVAKYLDAQVFTASMPDEVTAEKRAELIHSRRLILIHFCRALPCCVFDPRLAAPVFKYYVSINADYGDIIKEAVKRLQDTSRNYGAQCIAATLVELFTDQTRRRRFSRVGKEMVELKELARKLSASFGAENERSRIAMGALHKYCMEFIKTSINNDDLARRVMFFDILAEFLPRLLNSDKKRLVEFLGRPPFLDLTEKLPNDTILPFLQYRNLLISQSRANDHPPRINALTARKARRPVEGNGAPLVNHAETPDISEIVSVNNDTNIESVEGDVAAGKAGVIEDVEMDESVAEDTRNRGDDETASMRVSHGFGKLVDNDDGWVDEESRLDVTTTTEGGDEGKGASVGQ